MEKEKYEETIEKIYPGFQCDLVKGAECTGPKCRLYCSHGVYCFQLQAEFLKQEGAKVVEQATVAAKDLEKKRIGYKYYFHLTWLLICCANLGIYAYRLRWQGPEILTGLDYYSLAFTMIIGIYQYRKAVNTLTIEKEVPE